MAKVYLDTSFVSACVTTRDDAASVVRHETSTAWWQTQQAAHDLYISAEVVNELDTPGYPSRADALVLIETIATVPVTEEVLGLAEVFIAEKLMPGPLGGDAIHVAACCVHGIEYLLSWNVRHLANPNKLAHLRAVCRRLAVVPPTIVTPDYLWGDTP